MNEQLIDELEKRAWEYVDATWDWANPDNPNKATIFKAKFAELIVMECARIDSEENNPCHIDGESYNFTILNHFGVKR